MLREWTARVLRQEIYVLLIVHQDMSVQQEPTGCTTYFQFISIINLYMFRAGLLLIMSRYYSFQSNTSTSTTPCIS
jgi:hypothetical protein